MTVAFIHAPNAPVAALGRLAPLGVARVSDPGLADLDPEVIVVRAGALAALCLPPAAVAAQSQRLARAAAAADALRAFAPIGGGAGGVGAVAEWLHEARHGLIATLARLDGCAEWVATLTRPGAEPAAAFEAESAAAALAERLSGVARATLIRGFRRGPRIGAELAILAPRASERALRARLDASPEHLSVVGPAPAFTFCGGVR
jgi:hypothetical protein